MKILHIVTGCPLSYQGGITNYVRDLAKTQSNNGHNVWVMCSYDNNKCDNINYKFCKSNIQPLTLGKMIDKKVLRDIDEFLKEQAFDLVHLHMMLDLDWDLFDVLKKYKYVVSLHDYFYLCPRIKMVDEKFHICGKVDLDKCKKCVGLFDQYSTTRRINRKLNAVLNIKLPHICNETLITRFKKMKNLLEGAQILLPVSNKVEEIYRKSGISNNYKVLHIGNISANNFSNITTTDNVKNDKIRIAMLSSLMRLKGGDIYIKFAKEFDPKKYEFHFWGRADDLSNELKNSTIIDHGAYKQSDLTNILSTIDIGMVLSIWEDNAPQVVMEFLNNKVPVVGTKMGGIPDFIDNRVNGILFDPYDNKEINSIIEFFNNKFTIEMLLKWKKNIKRTKTPNEHYLDLLNVYTSELNIK